MPPEGRPKLSQVTAMVLAGGLASRLGELARQRPKALAEIRGRPFLSYLLDQFEAAGLRSVVLCTGHLGDQLETTFGRRYGNLGLTYSREPEPLGTAGALAHGRHLVASDFVLVANGDSYCEVDLGRYLAWHHQRAAAASLVLTEVDDVRRYGQVVTDDGGRVLAFHEKGADGAGQAVGGSINAGLYLLARERLEDLPACRPLSLEHDVFPGWIGKQFYGYRGGGFVDIGTPASYKEADLFFADRAAK